MDSAVASEQMVAGVADTVNVGGTHGNGKWNCSAHAVIGIRTSNTINGRAGWIGRCRTVGWRIVERQAGARVPAIGAGARSYKADW